MRSLGGGAAEAPESSTPCLAHDAQQHSSFLENDIMLVINGSCSDGRKATHYRSLCCHRPGPNLFGPELTYSSENQKQAESSSGRDTLGEANLEEQRVQKRGNTKKRKTSRVTGRIGSGGKETRPDGIPDEGLPSALTGPK